MIPAIATFCFAIGIWGLFALDRQPEKHMSKALWIPVCWLLIGGSRNVGEWLQMQGPSDQNSRYLDGNPLDRAILAMLIAIGLFILFKRVPRVKMLLRANSAVLIYFFYCGLSSVWSDFPDVAIKRWVRGLGDLVVVLLILTETDWVSSLKRVLARVGFMLLPLSVLLIRYFPNLGRGYSMSGESTYWTGVTSDKNGLGMICLIFGLGCLWRFGETYRHFEEPRRIQQLMAGGILLSLTLYLLWESNSMTSISCFVLAGGLMLSTGRWPRTRKPLVTFLLTATAVGVSAFVLFGGAGSVLEYLGRNPTLTGRTEVWSAVLPFAQNPIIGTGYESFWLGPRLLKIGDLTSSGINEAHNGYLEIYLNLGWVGLILLGFVIVTGLGKVIRAVNHDPDVGKLRLAYFTLALIYNFTEAAFKMQNPVWVFFLLAIMAIPSAAVSKALPALKFRHPGGIQELSPAAQQITHSRLRRQNVQNSL